VWLWTVAEGVFYWAGSNDWRRLDPLAVPNWTKVSATLADPDGLIWMASRDGELFRISEQLATLVRQPVEVDQTIVQTCAVTRDGTLWLGTDAAGAFRFEEGRLVHETNGLSSLRAQVIFEDSRTNLWVGTQAGLHRWDGRQFRRLTRAGLNQGDVRALGEDRAGNLWIGNSTRGLARLAPNGELTWYDASVGLKSYYIRAIVEDAEGRICVSAPREGLFRLVGGQFESFLKDRWAGADSIHELLPDPNGGVWITTYGKGLFFFKDGDFRHWGLKDGLPDVNLHGIAADDDGNLWVGSNRGIFGCAREKLLAYQAGRSAPLPCWRLTTADGLASKMTSGAGQPVVSRSADGRLWFPNLYALAVFDPKEVVSSRRSFPPVFEEVVSDGVVFQPAADGVVRLRSTVRRLELHYSCAELAAPEMLRFRYQLEGNDDHWTEAGNQRVAYYSRLTPGDYHFRVMAAGASGEWCETPRSLTIKILPFWWERPTVKVAGGLALLGLVAMAVWMIGRARLQRRLAYLERQRALEQERTRIARDIHDGLGAGLTQISLLGSMTSTNATDGEQVRHHADKVGDVSRRLTRALDEIVWAVRPQNDRLSRVVQYIAAMTHDLCDGTPVQSLFHFPASLPETEVSANARHNLVLACREAVTNVLKHSGATQLQLRVELERGALVVEVLDDGCGFDERAVNPERSGLRNMRQRLAEAGGVCEFQRRPEGGTKVRFRMPLPASPVTRDRT
jgi:signal transduction histidine kinase/streptogramin lyase